MTTSVDRVRDYQPPAPCGLSRAAIESIARKASAAAGYKPGMSLHPLIMKLGGRIEYADLTKESGGTASSLAGWIEVDGLRKFRVILSDETTSERDQFTLAHELGHYALHYVMRREGTGEDFALRAKDPYRSTEGGIRSSNPIGLAEHEANWFAMEFLMPEEEFKRQFKGSASISAIAKYFGVPVWIAEIRAEALGLS